MMKPLYVNSLGEISCLNHAGHYAKAAITSDPTNSFWSTPLGTWTIMTSEDFDAFLRIVGQVAECGTCKHERNR